MTLYKNENFLKFTTQSDENQQKQRNKFINYFEQDPDADINDLAKNASLEGDWEFSEFLRTKHAAQVDIIARFAAQGGNEIYAEFLRINCYANIDDIGFGAAEGGHENYAEYLRSEHHANPDNIAEGAAQGNHLNYAERLWATCKANIVKIAWGANQYHDFESHDDSFLLLHLASIENDAFRTAYATQLKALKFIPYDINSILLNAKKLAQTKKLYQLNDKQALEWIRIPELRSWFVDCASLVHNHQLSLDTFINIASYFSKLSIFEIKDLYGKTSFHFNKKNLRNKFGLFREHQEKLHLLSTTCEKNLSDALNP